MDKKHKYLKRFLAFVLSAAMVVTYMPTSLIAYASETDDGQPAATETVVDQQQPAETQPDVNEQTETQEQATEETPVADETTEPVKDAEEPVEDAEEPVADTEKPKDEQPEAEKVTYPAATFSDDANGVSVSIDAPEGAFPKGTTMKVTPVDQSAIMGAVSDAVDGDVTKIKAVDITFYNADGIEIEPLKEISVSLHASGIDKKADSQNVVHIDNQGNAEVVTKADTNGSAQFSSDAFSVWAIVSETDPANATYEFYVGDEMVRSQKVVNGDTLFEPDTPASESGKFLGWYVDDTLLQFENGVITVSGLEGKSKVRVEAKFGEYYYATFRDQDGNIVSRVEVAKGANLSEAPSITPKKSNQRFVGWSATEGGTTPVAFPYQMSDNVTFYPIVEEGYWVHFDANRDHVAGMENVNVSYTSPEFVKDGERATAPKAPVADLAVYTFEGWYTDKDCTQEFIFGSTPITEDITLYANWTVGQAKYNVVIWQQQVTDDKNATGDARKWDYVRSYEYSAAIGSTVTYNRLPNNIKNLSYTGFTRDHYDNSVTVAADGSTTLNVYYRRNLMTINFYVVNYNSEWYFNYDAYDEYSYYAKKWRTITGLYGATFAQSVSDGDNASDYIWPSSYEWYTNQDGGYYQSLLNAFTTNVSNLNFYCIGQNGNNTVYHVKQNSDGSWPTETQVKDGTGKYANIAKLDGYGSGFTITNKYDTFTAVAYSKKTYHQGTSGRTSATPGKTSVTGKNSDFPLYVYHARNSYTIEFYNENTKVDQADKLYEATLAEYASKTLTPADPARYTFGGWSFTPNDHDTKEAIDWSQETMPARTLKVYAIWVPVAYNVKLDLGASDAEMSDDQSRDFWPTYGATIDGSYMNAATRPGHTLVGWFDPEGKAWNFENAVTKDLCDEGPIHDPQYDNDYYVLHLTAKWRLSNAIKITYDVNGGTGNIVDNESYLQYGSAQVVSETPQPADQKHVFIGWADKKGNVYQPEDTIKIEDESLLVTDPKTGEITLPLIALYGTKVPNATVTYHATYNSDSKLDDNGGNYYDWNDTVTLPGDTFTREGYKLVGWSRTEEKAKAGTVDFEVGSSAYVSAMNTNYDNETLTGNNDLYAVWKAKVKVEVTGSETSKVYNGSEQTNTGYTVKYYAAGEEVSELPAGFTPSITASGDTPADGSAAAVGTNVGKYTTTVTATITGSSAQFILEDADATAIDDIVLNITPKPVTVKANDGNKVYDNNPNNPASYTATVTGTIGTDTVSYTVSRESGEDAGTYTITPTGDAEQGNYTVTYQTGTFTITKVEEEVVVTIEGKTSSVDYDGEEHTVSGYDVKSISNTLYTTSDFTGPETAEATRTDAGKTPMGLTAEQFTNTNKNFEKVTFNVTDGYQEIKPINVTVTITGHHDSLTYDGQEHSVSGYDVEISNPLYTEADFTFSGKAEAKRTVKGKTMMELAASQFTNKNDNFATVTFNVTDGYMEIVPVDEVVVTITGHNNTTDYDGEEHAVNGYDVEISNPLYKEADFTFSGKAEAKRTDAGTTNMGLAASQFTNNNENFKKVTFNVTDGYQTINPINATVTIVGKNNTADYDGEEHTVTGYDVTNISTELYKATDFTFSGKAEAKRTDAGTTNMGLAADQFTNTNKNFATVTFNVTDGYQKVDPIDAEVTITGHTGTFTYDGTEHTVEGYDAVADNSLYDVTKDFTFSGKDKVSRDLAGTTNMNLAAGQFTNTNKNFATVTFKVTDGYVKIDPLEVTVTVTGNNKTETYDGTAHTAEGYKMEADKSLYVPENNVTFDGTATATRTDAGQTDMGLAAEQFVNNNNNFDVTFEVTDGFVKINPASINDPDDPTKPASRIDADNPDDVTYNGSSQKQPVTVTDNGADGAVLGPDDIEITYSKDTTNVGTVTVTIAAKEGSNYTGSFTRTYKILPMALTITADSDTKEYDGEALTKDTYTNTDLAEGDSIESVTVTGSQTEVGSSDNVPSDAKIVDENGEDATANYDISYVAGKLTVTALPVYEITYDLNGGEYDGSTENIVEEHEKNEVIKIHEAPTREGYVFSYWKGSAYQPGDSYTVTEDHTFTAVWVAIEKTGDDSDSDSNKGVKTGDDNNLAGWLVMLLLAGAGIGGVGYGRRRKED